jgi:hypothetical protein
MKGKFWGCSRPAQSGRFLESTAIPQVRDRGYSIVDLRKAVAGLFSHGRKQALVDE